MHARIERHGAPFAMRFECATVRKVPSPEGWRQD
jgi:hypothetical protein